MYLTQLCIVKRIISVFSEPITVLTKSLSCTYVRFESEQRVELMFSAQIKINSV